MKIDIKAKIEEIVAKIKADPKLLASFKDEPIKTVESLIGIDLPDEQMKPLVDGIKAKLAAGEIGEKLGGLKNLFGK